MFEKVALASPLLTAVTSKSAAFTGGVVGSVYMLVFVMSAKFGPGSSSSINCMMTPLPGRSLAPSEPSTVMVMAWPLSRKVVFLVLNTVPPLTSRVPPPCHITPNLSELTTVFLGVSAPSSPVVRPRSRSSLSFLTVERSLSP